MRRVFISVLLPAFMACGAGDQAPEQPDPKGGTGQNPDPEPTGLTPLTERVNIQSELASPGAVIDGQWVAIGTKAEYAVQRDHTVLFNGKPSYRFELKEDDNTIDGYEDGTTKGRTELSYCYATAADYAGLPPATLANAKKVLSVYHHGKGRLPQGCTSRHTFSVRIPSEVGNDITTIFAQWHGMPDRTLVEDPDGAYHMLSEEEFISLCETMIFSNDTGYERVMDKDKNGNPKYDNDGNIRYIKGEPNGWMVDQGGYPPLEFGVTKSWFYIRTSSDSRWRSDNSDRTHAGLSGAAMKPVSSECRYSVVPYKSAFADFPRDQWVTFDVAVTWSRYGGQTETVESGKLDVTMHVGERTERLVDNLTLPIGRNDEQGYYFKFGIYRTASDTTPLAYNLAGYAESHQTTP